MTQQDLQQELLNIAAAGRQHPRDALARCKELLQQFPRLVPALCLAGRFYRVTGNLDRARYCLDEALSIDPAAVPAIAELAQLAIALHRYHDAEKHLRELIELKPGNADNWFNLGQTEEKLGRFEDAAESFRSALERAPHGPAEIYARLGGVLALAGHENDAETSYRHALGLDPDSPEAHFGLGLMAVSQGRLDDGIGKFRQSLEKRPGFAQAWQQILEARRIEKEDDADLVSVREALQQPALSTDDRESLNYALGKACDDLDQYKEAFSHFEAANRLKRQRLPAYDRVELERSTDALITASLADDRSDEVASGGILPVFVIGLPRSGTTLIDQILTSHPQATGLGESPFFQAALAGKSDGEWESITPDAIDDLRSRYLQLLDTVGGSVATNKYPANFRLVGLIKKVLPEARFVHVTRDPLDTCVSIFFQDFPSGNHYANDMEDLASYLAAYTRLMEHWREVLDDDSLLELSYEALLDDQQSESRRLLSFCGLDWDPICLDYADNSRRVSTLSRWQVRQPLYKTSLDRWKNYQDHLGVLIETVVEPAVNDVSG